MEGQLQNGIAKLYTALFVPHVSDLLWTENIKYKNKKGSNGFKKNGQLASELNR